MRTIRCASGGLLVMVVFASVALGWGSATHAYISQRLDSKGPLLTLNQVYGGMAVDTFNFMALSPEQQWLSTQVHCEDCVRM